MLLTNDNIIRAMSGTPVSRLEPKALADTLGALLRDILAYAGYDAPLILDNVGELAGDIRAGYGQLTPDEIRLACKAGLTGELGDTRKPTCAAVIRWVDAYAKGPNKADAVKIRKIRSEAPRQVTPEEGLAMMRDTMPRLARERWDSVRTTGAFPRHCLPHVSAQIYDWLKEEGRLSLPAEVRRAALDRARNGLVRGTSLPVGDLEAGERLTVSLAKHMALEDWMRAETRSGRAINLPPVRRIYE